MQYLHEITLCQLNPYICIVMQFFNSILLFLLVLFTFVSCKNHRFLLVFTGRQRSLLATPQTFRQILLNTINVSSCVLRWARMCSSMLEVSECASKSISKSVEYFFDDVIKSWNLMAYSWRTIYTSWRTLWPRCRRMSLLNQCEKRTIKCVRDSSCFSIIRVETSTKSCVKWAETVECFTKIIKKILLQFAICQ